MNNSRFEKFLSQNCDRVNGSLGNELELISRRSPKRLTEALRYVSRGGKRLRALLVYAVGKSYGANHKILDVPAVAIEMIHAFSLVHDDLPAMDNDSLRRGQPTCHIAFDEATAILAGDSLVVGAFESISMALGLTAKQKLSMVEILARASGASGMAGGQCLDVSAGKKITKSFLEKIYLLKTGALINAAISLGAIAAGITSRKELELLENLGLSVGLAFQIKDDILDIEGDVKAIGKNTGADKALNKITYPELVGLKSAKEKVKKLKKKVDDILSELTTKDSLLQELIDYIFKI